MKKKVIFFLIAILLPVVGIHAQSVRPRAYYVNDEGFDVDTLSIPDAQAPLTVTFRANPSDMDDCTPSFEWHFRKLNTDMSYEEILVRYEEETEYVFNESGTFNILAKTTITRGNETMDLDSTNIAITISESKLEFPNAFSPNNDNTNDVYMAKKGYKSIVSFHGYIFNRWGQKLFEWTDVSKGWDGTFNGKPVKEGVYFALIKAKGADGREYNIKRDVNLLRGFTEGGSSTTGTTN
jgi:gliding motility-associated-like protein